LTLIIYLNEGFEGGETIFFPEGKPQYYSKPNTVEEYIVVPKTGMAILFFHNGVLSPRHEGAALLDSDKYKYIIRSDVMFTKLPDQQPIIPTATTTKTVKVDSNNNTNGTEKKAWWKVW